jgi:hypothetical protein
MKYLVIEYFGDSNYFTTNDCTIDELVDEMYGGREEFDLEEAKKSFFETYDVFEIRGELVKIN